MRFACPFLCLSSSSRLAAAALFFSAAVAVSAGARAADAEALLRNGVELRKAGRDREALALFEQAVADRRTPRALAQLGLCEQALGLWAAAERHLDEALKSEGDVDWKKRNAKPLHESLAFVKGKLGSVDIWGTPDGATVALDDAVIGTLPLPDALRVGEGRRTFRVEAPGYVAETRTIDVRPGAAVREHVALARALRGQDPAGAAVPTLSRADSAAAGRATPVHLMVEAQPASRPEGGDREAGSPYYQRWWFWTAIAAGVIGAGVAAYLVARNDGGCVDMRGAPCWR